MRSIAVIGAMYGDEGKGQVVNSLVKNPYSTIVVRFNSGPQAGHTVHHNGYRHVFHTFGSGSLKLAPTYLGPEVCVDPFLLMKESEELTSIYTIFINPKCRVILPHDVIANQRRERGTSCGVGFLECINRTPIITIDDLFRKQTAKDLWNEVNLTTNTPCVWFDRWYEDIIVPFLNRVSVKDLDISRYETVIYEGAQGLQLDQNAVGFPWVTPSNTGLTNIEHNWGLPEEVVYVSRTYAHRHGKGPLANETLLQPFTDETNISNEWQLDFRTGILDLEFMLEGINKQPKVDNTTLVITHAQHLETGIDMILGENFKASKDRLAELIDYPIVYSDNKETVSW